MPPTSTTLEPLAMTEPPADNRPLRLEFLDGLRGLAALYVVFAHTYMTVFAFRHGPLPRWLTLSISWMSTGRFAVDVFIVLSGYCLMLPLVRSVQAHLSGGLKQFFVRRARRILPPYYAALGISLLVSALFPSIFPGIGVNWSAGADVLTTGALWSHILLIHNLFPRWIGTIDYPMWSVATEWQVYFFFGFLLLPVWRRYGPAAMLAISLVVGIGLDRLFPASYFHFLALFAFGMIGAAIAVSPSIGYQRLHKSVPWGLLAGSLAVSFFVFLLWKRTLRSQFTLPIDLLVGIITVCVILSCMQRMSGTGGRAARPALLTLLESRWAVGLGIFSYSLYLTHAIVLALVFQALRPLPLSGTLTCLLYFAVCIPASLLAAFGFHLVFERPFLRRRRRETTADLAQDAALAPAP